MERKVLSAMTELGFTKSESKVYTALLKKQPATGYELAASSGVPRSAIYNILKKLEGGGLINAIQDKPARYVPLPPEHLCELLKGRFDTTLEDLKHSLESLVDPVERSVLWQLQDYRAILDHARQIISQAKSKVVISMWNQEAQALESTLTESWQRGVHITTFSFTDLPKLPGTVLSYGIPEPELEEHWPHKLVLIADDSVVLIGHTNLEGPCHAVAAREEALVEMAQSNVIMDLTLFGQRFEVDTESMMKGLLEKMAPLDELIERGNPFHHIAKIRRKKKKTK
ncbi:MAG: TrmB family transcriptional regulator [Deltaproteobacteria bacterium]|nr:TrmB family transcriptional regulator [Deltaproteobacteria bacterium]MBT6433355.1 TrmB family transcriptional regulator [Deltaproteobacteria bacterium]MBT6490779.1 TrmB family transcriptional regulator [Deltaproteobacteria bacterium]